MTTFAAAPAGAAGSVRLAAEYAVLDIALTGAAIRTWRTCRTACKTASAGITTVSGDTDKAPAAILVAPDDPHLNERLRNLQYTVRSSATADARILGLISEPLAGGVRIELDYRLHDGGRRLALAVQLTGPGATAFRHKHELALRLYTNAAFNRSVSAGFTGMVETARYISLANGQVRHHAPGETWRITNSKAAWSGIRNRFWALLAAQPAGFTATAGKISDGGDLMTMTPASSDLRFEIYAGPVEPAMLSRQPGGLEALWLSGLWDWLRMLALGLYSLLELLKGFTGGYGLAIVALALAVKLIMLPLTLIAMRWQQQVNTVQARLQPELRRIKAEYRDEQQAEQLLALYRQHGVTPLYPIKSLFGVLIQLPVFIGVFDMLLHHPGLAGAGFLWVEDLARPDRLAALPFVLPFFGGYFNLLPFLMTAINLIGTHQSDTAGLGMFEHRGRQRQLYALSLAFLVLFYTFPAGMVLYWTCTNLFHVLGEQVVSRLHRRSAGLPSRPVC